MNTRSLNGWLQYIESLHPSDMELGLERIREVQQRLPLKKPDSIVVTVAGTNGKGSTIAYLEAMYQAAAYKTGCYTSPHLVRFNERVRINGHCVDDETLCLAFDQVESTRQDIALTYFEFTTLAALQILFAAGLDVILLEVGLGGRLDAVNIVDPDVAVVTAIDLDHQAWLGETRELIGYEKAGIFRKTTPAVCSDPNPPVSLIDHAQQVGASLYLSGREYRFEAGGDRWSWAGIGVQYNDLVLPALLGEHQLHNAAGSIAATQLLCDRLPVTQAAINEGLSSPRIHGRTEIIDGSPQLVLDVAHNPQATTQLARTLATLDLKDGQRRHTVAVVGMLKDKDIERSLHPMMDIVQHWYVADLPGPRAASAQRLANILRSGNEDAAVSTYTSVPDALTAAMAEAQPESRIVVFGSFHTVGGIMPQINKR